MDSAYHHREAVLLFSQMLLLKMLAALMKLFKQHLSWVLVCIPFSAEKAVELTLIISEG